MPHVPINHRMRPFYRGLAGLIGLYLLAFGIVGLIKTRGQGFFERTNTESLGLRTNMAFALLSVIVGAIVFVGALIGRNFDHFINLWGGAVFWLSGLVMLAVMQTEANLLNFGVSTCVVSFLIGTALFLAGLYGKTGTAVEALEEETFRHSSRGVRMPVAKPHLGIHPGVKHKNA